MQQAVVKLDTKPSLNLSLSDQEIYILCKTLRSALSRLRFECLAQKNNLSGTGVDWEAVHDLEGEIKAAKGVLGRLDTGMDKKQLEEQLERDLKCLERMVLVGASIMFQRDL